MRQSDLAPDAWRLESTAKLKLLERIKAVGVPLGQHVGKQLYRGITTGLNRAFVVDRETRDQLIADHPGSKDVLKPFLRGRDIQRWRTAFDNQYLIFTRQGIDIKRYPAIERYLKRFKSELDPQPDGWNLNEDGEWRGRKAGSYKWYEIQDNIAYWQQFEGPKIVSTKVSIRPTFALELNGCYLGNTSYFFPTEAGEYFLAILNSNVGGYYAKKIFVEKQNGWYEVQPETLKTSPIPNATPQQRKLIELLAKAVIRLSGEAAMAAYFERLLNGMVYELFFPEDLHAQNLRFFDLLSTAGIPSKSETFEWGAFHERIANVNHPIYAALFALNGLEVVRIIEDRE